ncbi:MAG: RHS repeat-associated core domain-containing protein, partial [Solirubrobacteraceae bacterium]|nr:RHS repeat-associated core domain-containing protein [Solirubrobacteraceae bacterium]
RAAPTSGRFTLTDNASGVKYGWYDGPFAYTDQMTDQYGNTTSFEAHGTGNALSKIIDSRGRGYTLTSNSDGFITSLNVPSSVITGGETWTYTYDPGNDLVRTATDPVGNVTHYDYTTDGSDLLTKITDARGNDTLIVYNSDQAVTSITRKIDGTTANDIKTTFAYKSGAAIDSWCPVADLTATPPKPKTSGETLVTDPNGHTTTYCWDQEGAVLKARDALGHDTATTYNPQGNSTKFSQYAGTSNEASNSVTFDASGQNPAHITDSTGAKTDAVYPTTPGQSDLTASRPTQITNPQGKVTDMTYNAQGSMLTSKSGTNLQATLAYNTSGADTSGSLKTATDGKGNVTTYQYNANHELWKVIPQPLTPVGTGAAMGTTTYTYDGLSRVATVTDGNGKVLTFGYDKNNRNVTIADSDGKTTTLVYDADGNITSRTEGTNTSTYGYDKVNRKTSETLAGSGSNAYTYDKGSNLKTLTDASGTVTYSYDEVNRTKSVVAPTATTGNDTTNMEYHYPNDPGFTDGTHTMVIEKLPGNATVKQTSDTAGKLTDLIVQTSTGAQTMHRLWNYTAGSTNHELVDSTVDFGTGSTAVTTTGYAYGDNDMLTLAQTINGSGGSNVRKDQFTYDGAGNRTARTTTTGAGALVATTYAYNADNQLCWQATGTSATACSATAPAGATAYTYDGAGNQLTGGVAMAWDGKNRLKTVAGGNVTTLSPTNGEITGVGTSSYQNTVLGVGRTTVSGTLAQIVRDPGSGEAVSQIAGGVKRWFVTDNIGSTIALVDGNAGVQKAYSYDVDGNASVTTPGSGPGTQITYVGGLDVGNGLMHYGARYYQPSSGRWTQPDPLRTVSDLANANAYLYVGSDPVNNADPSGLCIVLKCKTWHSVSRVSGAFVEGAAKGCVSGAIVGGATGGPAGAASGCATGGFVDGGLEAGAQADKEIYGDKYEKGDEAASKVVSYGLMGKDAVSK